MRCRDCKYWDQASIHASPPYGVCLKSLSQAGLFYADDDIQAYAPHLLTKPEFGCIEFQPVEEK